ncbi:MAG TPA: cAMP-activated global transcriptional regulator CRP [Xanthomonadaceae bacterium]|nr:cAMP-activated global transcriptional regulator CRP [Xanthomonadaceae bacterium]
MRYGLHSAMPQVRHPGFLQLDRASLDRFLALCHLRKYPNRAVVLRPGDEANTLHYVISGSLMVTVEETDGREITLARLNPGEFIGEMGLFVAPQKRTVSVKARSPCELAEISYERLFQLLEGPLRADCQRILFAIGAQLSQRLLQSRRKVRRLAFMDVITRVARTLVDLCAEPDAMSHPRGTQIKVSRVELSHMVGCSREVAGKALKQLEEQGMISASGKTVVVHRAGPDQPGLGGDGDEGAYG